MIEFSVRSVRIRFYFGFFAVVLFSFFAGQADSLGVIAALVCCVLHEMGHLAVMCLLSSPPDKICFYAGGIKIVPRRAVTDSRAVTAAVLSAGCTVNFFLAAVSRAVGLNELFEINLALGAFNLLPFSYFDGGRILEMYAPDGMRKVCAAVCAVLLTAAMLLTGGVSPAVIAVLAFVAVSEIFM